MGVKFNPFTSKLDIVDSPSGEFSDIELALGTQTAPSLSFTGDPNTGIYSPGADQLAISTGGTGRLFVDASGYVGVGQASPSTYFHINGGTVNNVAIFESTDAGAGIILKDSTGSSTLQTNGAVLQFGVDEDNAVANSAITFRTDNGERLRLTSDGKLGLGTGSPGSFGFFAVRGSAALGGSYGNVSAHFSDGATTSLFIKHAAGELGYFTDGAVAQTFYTSSTERARIDSSGRLLVGTASSPSAGQGQYSRIVVQGYIGNDTSAGYFSLARGEAATSITSGETIGVINFTDNAGNTFAQIIADADAAAGSGDYPGRLVFSTTADGESSPTERMRIASNGSVATFCSNATDGIWASSAATAGTARNLFIGSYGGSNVYSGTISYRVYTNGNVVNTNDSYGPLVSDIKYKENIVDAGSQWDDFKAIKFRKFNFKPETGFDTFTQLGVIAQEVELVSPGLVVETPDVDENGNDLGTTTKTVKSSVLTKKALIALQEAMERIENLEAEVAALKGS